MTLLEKLRALFPHIEPWLPCEAELAYGIGALALATAGRVLGWWS